ncbi:hypothetical protein GCM10008929_18950 [Alkalibacterium psychrotolerans]
MRKILVGLGTLAVLLYVSHVIIGGLLWDTYSHSDRPISDLTASGAPNRGLLSVLTVLYAEHFSLI